jgi:hypothetical protein
LFERLTRAIAEGRPMRNATDVRQAATRSYTLGALQGVYNWAVLGFIGAGGISLADGRVWLIIPGLILLAIFLGMELFYLRRGFLVGKYFRERYDADPARTSA